MTKNFKIFQLKKILFFKLKIAIYLSLGLHEGGPSYMRKKPSALKREHPTLQTKKISKLFPIFGAIFSPP
jgi:hypothetical protein